MSVERRLYTADVAEALNISEQTAAKYMDTMPCVYLPGGGRRGIRYVKESDLEAWEAERKAVRADAPRPGRTKRAALAAKAGPARIPRRRAGE